MTKALPPGPPHTPPRGDNVRQIHAIAIVQKSDPGTDAMYEQIRALRNYAHMTSMLQRRIDALEAAKALRNRELTVVVKRTHAELGEYLTGRPYEDVAGAIKAVMDALAAGETPLVEDIREIMARVPGSRDRWIEHEAAEATKKAEMKRAQDKIDEVEFALSKLCRHGIDGKAQEKTAQADLPGVDVDPPRAKSWMDPKMQRVVYDTVAEEVKTADATVKTATASNDRAAAEAAAREREAHQTLLDDLLLSGFVSEPEEGEEREDQAELKLEDDAETDEDGVPPDAIDIGDAKPPEAPVDPADHPALKGHIADAASKRAKNKAEKPKHAPSNHP